MTQSNGRRLPVRDDILRLRPYRSARDEFSGTARIFLDANENPLGSAGGGALNRYPDPAAAKLKEAAARLLKVRPEQLFTGNGSDEIIDLLFRVCCRPGYDKAAMITPSYGMYRVCADIAGVETVEIPLNSEFDLDLELTSRILAANPEIRLLFLCSPNNPSGNLLCRDKVLSLAASFNGITAVDEAYIDFAADPGLADCPEKYPRLVIIRTFSKAWGLAAIRLGLAIADPDLIRILNKVKLPYNINGLTAQAALRAVGRAADKETFVRTIVAERQRLARELEQLDAVVRVMPSDANFLLVRMSSARSAYEQLLAAGIVVRDRSNLPGCEECLRISVGTPAQNRRLTAALKTAGENP